MKQVVTIRYGIDQITKEFDVPVSIGMLQANASIRAGLGYGDSTKWLIGGIEMGADVIVPNGAVVVVETRANVKAS